MVLSQQETVFGVTLVQTVYMVIMLLTLVNPCFSIIINAIIVFLVPNYRYFIELTSDVDIIFLNILEFKKKKY